MGPSMLKDMLVHNKVIKIVVAAITTRILEDIHTLVCKQLFIMMPPPSSIVQDLNTKVRHDLEIMPVHLPPDVLD